MTIGPEPMMRTRFRSVRRGMMLTLGWSRQALRSRLWTLAGGGNLVSGARLGAIDEFQEIVKQVVGVVRPRRCLRMILHREHGPLLVAKPLDGSVVQIDVSDFDVVRKRCRVHGKAMILRRDFDLASLQLLHRVVGAAVAELQLECLPAHRQAQNLMAETDAKYRNAGRHKRARVLDGVGQRRGIAWAI